MRLQGADIHDTIQVLIGASAVAVPIAFTEEAWNMSEDLPVVNLLLIVLLSLGFCALYAFSGIYQSNVRDKVHVFVKRSMLDYGISIVVVFVVLLAINRLPLIDEPMLGLRRIIVVAFPACMGAVIVDGIDKE